MTVYTLVVPQTWRGGPGHRSHLSPKPGVTCCKVENNARGLRPLSPHLIEPSSDVDYLKRAATEHSCRHLCANCYEIATRAT